MVGILVIVLISWLLLHFVESRSLLALGVQPTRERSKQLLIGFLFMGVLNISFLLIEFQVKGTMVTPNSDWTALSLLNSLWYHIKSALTEDLIFRGALLYILIRRLGTSKALFISAFGFGIYHLFSYGMIGGPIVPIVFVVVTTGLMGYVWAYSFAKTNSIMMPLGMHVSWNFVTTLYGDTSPYGELLYSLSHSIDPYAMSNTVFAISKGILVPIVVYLFLKNMPFVDLE